MNPEQCLIHLIEEELDNENSFDIWKNSPYKNLVKLQSNNVGKVGEKLVQSYKNFFDTIILRPGTVCGFSKSLRLDLTVNAMTYTALKNKMINVNGGNQIRPHVHMEDMINAYLFFLNRKNISGIYNVGFENHSIIYREFETS